MCLCSPLAVAVYRVDSGRCGRGFSRDSFCKTCDHTESWLVHETTCGEQTTCSSVNKRRRTITPLWVWRVTCTLSKFAKNYSEKAAPKENKQKLEDLRRKATHSNALWVIESCWGTLTECREDTQSLTRWARSGFSLCAFYFHLRLKESWEQSF